jgi:AcrR family transcriptional regulator
MNDTTRGPGRPSGVDRRRVRERLLEAALALFTRHGFDGVSMRRLAREAGATPAMIHYYFGDKHGLFRALLEEVLAPRLDELEALAGKRPVTLAEFMGVFISMFAEHPWIPPLVFREVVDGPAEVRRRFAQRMAGRFSGKTTRLTSRAAWRVKARHRRSRVSCSPQPRPRCAGSMLR